MTDATPVPEQTWVRGAESSLPQNNVESLAEGPLAVVSHSSSASSNEDKVIDNEAPEDSSSSNDDDEKEREKNIVRPVVERTQSTWTTTSAATSIAQPQEQPVRKQTWSEKLNPLKRKKLPPIPETRAVSREYGAGFFNKLYFQWMAPLMSVGYQRPLEVTDIWKVNPDRSVEKLQPMLEENLRKRKAAGSKRPLQAALFDTFKREFIIGGACQLTAACVQVLSPFTMKYLIAFAGEAYYATHNGTPAPSIGRGVGLVIGITCMQMIQSLTTNHFIYRGMTVGGQARGALIAIIFDKAMKLSGRAKAGGKPADAKMETPEGMVPGSKEEKKFLKQKLGK
ncbi:ATP-binding cassette transporter yor1 [Friedmanniomyces endolithicus]|nr:ATP-binding cassette transporter yor1 [Friedmanniomyces endolithicus]